MQLVHDLESALLSAPTQALFAADVRFGGHLPTNGSLAYRSAVPETGPAPHQIVADNLRRLMEYASDNPGRGWPSTKKGLERRIDDLQGTTGLTIVRSTIQRALAGKTAPGVDTLGAIAAAYDLSAWQLLVPDLDPEQPPVLFGVTLANALMTSLRTVARQHEAPKEPRKKRQKPRRPSPNAGHARTSKKTS